MPHELYQHPAHLEPMTVPRLIDCLRKGADRLPSPLPIERDAMRIAARALEELSAPWAMEAVNQAYKQRWRIG